MLVDLPPLLPVVDVGSLAPYIDSFIFVIDWGETPRDIVSDTLKRHQMVWEKTIGTLLNKVEIRQIGRYNEHSTNYYSRHYTQ